MNSKGNQYRKFVMILVMIGIILLGYLFVSKKGIFDKSMKLYILTEDASGIYTETPILINGFEIGKVSGLSLSKGRVFIELSIDEKIEIRKSSQFISTLNGIMGDKHIEVKNISEVNEFYRNGDTILSLVVTPPTPIKLIDSKIEPKLKALSKAIGKALQDYGESAKDSNTIDK